jgi:simple sugar transport system substrate-binding protein
MAGIVGAIKVATFDLGPDVLREVRDGRILFAVDQQAYLQGYLPVVMLAQRSRYGLFPARGDVIATGPNFVTRRNAGKALALSRRSIR